MNAPVFVPCENCGQQQATMSGGLGTDQHPWQWSCAECEHIFESNDYDPEED